MNTEEFKALVDKYLAGEASAEEERALFSHYDKLQQQNPVWDATRMGEEGEVQQRLYRNIVQQIKQREKRSIGAPLRWAMAASVMLAMLSSVLYFYWVPPKEEAVSEIAGRLPAGQGISPGGNKAVLTLADGARIVLDDAVTGELARQSGIRITKAADGQIIYQVADQAASDQAPAIKAYNTIETPKGGQYQVNLPDGTRVWLNAGSALRFPTRFAGRERQVDLQGEAYFEVAENKAMPFRVLSDNQVVEVVGTHFNVDAYGDEGLVKTTLLEGAVRIRHRQHRQARLLQPGQQALVREADQQIAVQDVDTEEAVAWKNGYFMFVEEDLKSIMRKLERWYDVEVEFVGEVEKLKFGGVISRSKSMEETLRILELTGNVHFKVAGRRVTVMP